jgi:pilus assembly protein CpaE
MQRIMGLAARQVASGRDPAKTIGFISAKGGSGATSMACHVAAHIREATTGDVLLADLDFESGMIGFLMKADTSFSVADGLRNVHRLDASLWKGYVGTPVRRLDVIPAPLYTMSGEYARPDSMRQMFRLTRSMYDWIVADLGRGLNPLTSEVAADLDELCIVTRTAIPSLYRAKQLIARAHELGIPNNRLRLVLNQVAGREALAPEDIEKMLHLPVYASIPSRRGLDESYEDGKLVASDSPLGKHFASLASKLAGIEPAAEDRPRRSRPLFGRGRSAAAKAEAAA